jgi:hypothetical protein
MEKEEMAGRAEAVEEAHERVEEVFEEARETAAVGAKDPDEEEEDPKTPTRKKTLLPFTGEGLPKTPPSMPEPTLLPHTEIPKLIATIRAYTTFTKEHIGEYLVEWAYNEEGVDYVNKDRDTQYTLATDRIEASLREFFTSMFTPTDDRPNHIDLGKYYDDWRATAPDGPGTAKRNKLIKGWKKDIKKYREDYFITFYEPQSIEARRERYKAWDDFIKHIAEKDEPAARNLRIEFEKVKTAELVRKGDLPEV